MLQVVGFVSRIVGFVSRTCLVIYSVTPRYFCFGSSHAVCLCGYCEFNTSSMVLCPMVFCPI